MATNILPIKISFGALPPNVLWTPQQLGDAIAERLFLVTSQSFALFVSGSTEPPNNVGPWLKDSQEWWVWSDTLGAYAPQIINQESLGYFIGSTAPDPLIYQFWIKTALSGSPEAVMTYYSGAWTDVYTAVIGDYMTTAAFNAAIADYSTTAQMNAAISAAIAGTSSYIAKATNSAPQAVPVNNASLKVVLNVAVVNPSPAPFNTSTSRYVAPTNGNYQVNAYAQVDNSTGVAADMEIIWDVYINGVFSTGSGDSTPSPNGSRWWPKITDIFPLSQNDYVEIYIKARDGVNTGAIAITDANFSAIKIPG